MEKSDKKNTLIKIVITGPESTGKTWLAEYLAREYHTIFVPELAREYIGNLKRSYTYQDVEFIATEQIKKEEELSREYNGIIFFDTWLIITKIWFLWVYNTCPEWLLKKIENSSIDFFLLCATDIPWVDDPLRENGGENREKLFNIYKNELENYGFRYEIIRGYGDLRLENAKRSVDNFLKQNKKINFPNSNDLI